MREGILSVMLVLLGGAGLALAQPQSQPEQSRDNAWDDRPRQPSTSNAFRENDQAEEPGPLLWVSGEYLYWWINKGPLADSLVSFSLPNGVITNFGGENLPNQAMSGYRFSAGYALTPLISVEANGFSVGQRTTFFQADSDLTGNPVIGRPIIDTAVNQEVLFLGSFPNLAVGGVSISSSSQLHGAEGHVVGTVYGSDGFEFQLLGGYRYLFLYEDLRIQNSVTSLDPVNFPVVFNTLLTGAGAATLVGDEFVTKNFFHGAQIGARTAFFYDSLFAFVDAKLAIGSTREVLDIHGSSTLANAGTNATITVPAGILAVPSNIGVFAQDRFTVIPEAAVTVGYDITRNVQVFAGYHILHWDNVIRPGQQINRTVDTIQVPTAINFVPGAVAVQPPSPAGFPFPRTAVTIHGASVGLSISY